MEKTNKTDWVKITLIITNVILLGVIGFLVYSNQEKSGQIEAQNQNIETKDEQITAKTKELEELLLAYERVKMEREELNQNNDSLNTKIADLQNYIAQVKKGNNKNIKELNDMIAKLKVDIDAKDQEIAVLRTQNDSLTADVSRLNQEKVVMNDTIASINKRSTELAEKVAIASMLKADKMSIAAISSKGKELSGEEYKGKNISQLRVNYSLADNRVARKNSKVIYFRLIEPSGDVVYETANGGGFFNADGKDAPFTLKQTVAFDNSGKQLTFTFLKGGDYKEGTYKVELYASEMGAPGYKIGETTFKVK